MRLNDLYSSASKADRFGVFRYLFYVILLKMKTLKGMYWLRFHLN